MGRTHEAAAYRPQKIKIYRKRKGAGETALTPKSAGEELALTRTGSLSAVHSVQAATGSLPENNFNKYVFIIDTRGCIIGTGQ